MEYRNQLRFWNFKLRFSDGIFCRQGSLINLFNKNIGIIVTRFASNKPHITLTMQDLYIMNAHIPSVMQGLLEIKARIVSAIQDLTSIKAPIASAVQQLAIVNSHLVSTMFGFASTKCRLSSNKCHLTTNKYRLSSKVQAVASVPFQHIICISISYKNNK